VKPVTDPACRARGDFGAIVIMVILTTLLTPPMLTFLLRRQPE